MKEFTVTKNEEGMTLLKYSSKKLKNAPQGMIRKFLRNKNIELNRKRSDGHDLLKEGDRIGFFLSDETMERFGMSPDEAVSKKTDVPLLEQKRIIYEDEDFLFYDKPAGLLSQSDDSKDPSLNDSLLKYAGIHGVLRPSICNRLDRNTSGLIMCAKTHNGLNALNEAIKNRRIKKYYLCILDGRLKTEGTFEAYLKKDNATNTVKIQDTKADGFEKIMTGYRIIKSSSSHTLAEVFLHTGKPHQIRAMSAYLGAPVTGDRKYGSKKGTAKRQLLHSYRIELPGDILNGKSFEAPIPRDMLDLIDRF